MRGNSYRMRHHAELPVPRPPGAPPAEDDGDTLTTTTGRPPPPGVAGGLTGLTPVHPWKTSSA